MALFFQLVDSRYVVDDSGNYVRDDDGIPIRVNVTIPEALAMLAERHPGSEPVLDHSDDHGDWARLYEGKVLADREENHYDDSDFYAIVWTGSMLRKVYFATTRAAGCGRCEVDATDEVKAAATMENEAYLYRIFKADAKRDMRESARQARHHMEHSIVAGRKVKVVKGRKVPVGTIAWASTPWDGTWGEICNLHNDHGNVIAKYVATQNLEPVDPNDGAFHPFTRSYEELRNTISSLRQAARARATLWHYAFVMPGMVRM